MRKCNDQFKWLCWCKAVNGHVYIRVNVNTSFISVLLDTAGGDMCEVFNATCDKTCMNGGECFLVADSYTAGHDVSSVCLCGGQWSGDT